jgi:hypothetical protein
MLFEPKIGKLIRKLNPYTDGSMDTMLCGGTPPNLTTLGTLVSALGQALTALGNGTGTVQQVKTAEDNLDKVMDIFDFNLRVDNDYRQDYMTWIFRTQQYAVKRALRITYRYELTDKQGNKTGIFATEHVLIGYAGSNG